jgi:hypothetical protein
MWPPKEQQQQQQQQQQFLCHWHHGTAAVAALQHNCVLQVQHCLGCMGRTDAAVTVAVGDLDQPFIKLHGQFNQWASVGRNRDPISECLLALYILPAAKCRKAAECMHDNILLCSILCSASLQAYNRQLWQCPGQSKH